MKALGGPYLRVFVSRERVANCCADFPPRREEFGFHVNQKRVVNGLVLFRAKSVGSVSSAAPIENDLETEEIQTLISDQPNTVKVRFKLQKQCAFGQHFVVVGDDPNLGLWNPSDGLPLDWSEGHVWTAQVDVPSSKVINFKFILKELSGAVHWQPGPDRVLETWDTAKTISVSEDWDSPELQNVFEEELIVVDDVSESSLDKSDSLIAENLNQIVVEEWDDVMKEEDEANERTNDDSEKPSSVDENVQDLSLRDEGSDLVTVAEKGMMVINGSNSSCLENEVGPSVDEGVPVLVPGLATIHMNDDSDKPSSIEENVQDLSLGDEGCDLMSVAEKGMMVINGSNSSSLENEAGPSVDEGVPVLVPGLGIIPHEEFESEELKMEGNISMVECDEDLEVITTTLFDEIEDKTDLNRKDNNFVEDSIIECDETEAASVSYEEASEVVVEKEEEEEEEEERRCNGEEKMGRNIFYSNIEWGRQRLHKFLANLGFMRHT